MPAFGTITVTFSSGPALTGPGTYHDADGPQPYLDYTGRPFPSRLDMKKATGVSFQPYVGRRVEFSSWEYLYNGGWVGPRLVVQP